MEIEGLILFGSCFHRDVVCSRVTWYSTALGPHCFRGVFRQHVCVFVLWCCGSAASRSRVVPALLCSVSEIWHGSSPLERSLGAYFLNPALFCRVLPSATKAVAKLCSKCGRDIVFNTCYALCLAPSLSPCHARRLVLNIPISRVPARVSGWRPRGRHPPQDDLGSGGHDARGTCFQPFSSPCPRGNYAAAACGTSGSSCGCTDALPDRRRSAAAAAGVCRRAPSPPTPPGNVERPPTAASAATAAAPWDAEPRRQ